MKSCSPKCLPHPAQEVSLTGKQRQPCNTGPLLCCSPQDDGGGQPKAGEVVARTLEAAHPAGAVAVAAQVAQLHHARPRLAAAVGEPVWGPAVQDLLGRARCNDEGTVLWFEQSHKWVNLQGPCIESTGSTGSSAAHLLAATIWARASRKLPMSSGSRCRSPSTVMLNSSSDLLARGGGLYKLRGKAAGACPHPHCLRLSLAACLPTLPHSITAAPELTQISATASCAPVLKAGQPPELLGRTHRRWRGGRRRRHPLPAGQPHGWPHQLAGHQAPASAVGPLAGPGQAWVG